MAGYVKIQPASSTVDGSMSSADKTKLDGVQSGAQVNVVTSVFTRIGAVVAVFGDYAASLISNDSSVSGTTVKDALNALLSAISGNTSAISANTANISSNTSAIATNTSAIAANTTAIAGKASTAVATSSAAGLESAADKAKLDGIAAGAVSAHASLSGLSADDHTQYALVTGTRAFSGKITAPAYLESGITSLAYAPSLSIDCNGPQSTDIAKLTGNLALTWINAAAGRSGMFSVKQDTTGSRVVTITPPTGWTLTKSTSEQDLSAAPSISAITLYFFQFYTSDGVQELQVNKQFVG